MAAISRLSTENDDMLGEYDESCVFLAASNSHCYYLSNFSETVGDSGEKRWCRDCRPMILAGATLATSD